MSSASSHDAGPELGFVHRFETATNAVAPVLLLLHGTGGDETDLLPLGRALAPGAALLSPRGKVLENGMPRFFRRIAEGVFDQEDLARRTAELASFVEAAKKKYSLGERPTIALGFSNGANIAASLLLRFPEALDGAILIRAMIPFEPESTPDLAGKRILLLSGTLDPIVPRDQPERLREIFETAGASVTLHWERAGHALTQADLVTARDWFKNFS